MSLVRDPVRRRAASALLGTALMACNAVVGIEEPLDVSLADSGNGADAPLPRLDGPASMRDVGYSDHSPTVTDSLVPREGASPSDGATVRDGSARDGSGATARDAAGGTSSPDGRGAGGIVVPPSFASGSCTFSSIDGANADNSPYTSTQGVAKRKVTATDETIEITLTSFIRGVQRTVIVRFRGPLVAGKTIALDDVNVIEYYDVKTGYGWGSAFAIARAGILKIENVDGDSFSFALSNVKMGPHTQTVGSLGSFTLDGYGSANPQ